MAALQQPQTRTEVAPRKLERHEVQAASRALGRAFYDDPLMMYLMPSVYLETNKARNVVFYQKHGFRVREHFNCDGGRGPESWTMVRQNGQFHT